MSPAIQSASSAAARERLVADGCRVVAAALGVEPLHDPRDRLEPVRVVVADQAVGRLEDRGPGAVVPPEHDHPRLPVPLAELQDVADRRAAELVDRLVVVADHRDVAMSLGHQRHQLRLGAIGVLELVDEHVLEPPLDGLAGRRRLAQQPEGQRDLVPEVDRPVRGEQALVAGIGARELGLATGVLGEGRGGVAIGLRRRLPRRIDRRRRLGRPVREPAGVGEVGVRRDVLVLRAGEQRRERVEEPRRVAQRPVLVELELEQALAQEDHGLRAGQHPDVGRQAELERELPHEPVAECVERRDRRVRVAVRDQLVDAHLHLVGRLVREREREDLRRLRAPGRDQPGDPARDDLRLAGAGAGHDEQRAIGMGDRPALLRVQAGQERVEALRLVGRCGLDRRVLAPDGDLDERRRFAARDPAAHPQELVEGVLDRVFGRGRGRSGGGHDARMPRARASLGVTARVAITPPWPVPLPRPARGAAPRPPPARAPSPPCRRRRSSRTPASRRASAGC